MAERISQMHAQHRHTIPDKPDKPLALAYLEVYEKSRDIQTISDLNSWKQHYYFVYSR